jgi:hypothetical protein
MSKVLGVEFIVTIYAEQSNNCEAAWKHSVWGKHQKVKTTGTVTYTNSMQISSFLWIERHNGVQFYRTTLNWTSGKYLSLAQSGVYGHVKEEIYFTVKNHFDSFYC